MLNDSSSATAWDNVEVAVFLVRCIDSRPGAHSGMHAKAFTKVELVLMPGETQTDLGCFPDKEDVYA